MTGTDLKRRGRARILRVAFLSLIVGVTGCAGTSDDDDPRSTVERLRAAAETMEGFDNYRVDLMATTKGGPTGYDFRAVSLVHRRDDRTAMKIYFAQAADPRPLELVFDDDTVYVSPPVGSSTLTTGRFPWLRMDLPAAAELLRADMHDIRQLAEAGQFSALWGASDPMERGRVPVDGVDTTHFELTADLEAAAERTSGYHVSDLEDFSSDMGSPAVPMSVWIDDEDVVRRLEFDFPIAATGAERTATMRLEYGDLGGVTDVPVPPGDEVKNYRGVPSK